MLGIRNYDLGDSGGLADLNFPGSFFTLAFTNVSNVSIRGAECEIELFIIIIIIIIKEPYRISVLYMLDCWPRLR